ncbi:MAG: GNAT family N-acetyltransferase [Clostridia bacterium]|nr:GNAT family N-acetyltransferase [Clostridia bacterium]
MADNTIVCSDGCNMNEISFAQLKKAAIDVSGSRTLDNASAGATACAILTDKGNIYTGVSVNTVSVNICAEQSAVAAMVTACESHIVKVISVNSRGTVCQPCAKCLELMLSLCNENCDAEIAIGEDTSAKLSQLTAIKSADKVTVLESERLRLVPLTLNNISEVFESFTYDVTKYMYPSAPKEIAESEAFVKTTLGKMEKGREIVFAIRNKENDEFYGLVGIHNITSGAPEIGVWTKTAVHGKGYGFEAVSRIIAHTREHIPFEHIIYPVDKRNYPSRRIPILHGGVAMKEYNMVNLNGDTLEIIEYWIK